MAAADSIDQPTDDGLRQALEAAVPTAERWWRAAEGRPRGRSADLLARIAADPAGVAFLLGFVDGVVRPEDARTAARELHRLARTTPALPAGLGPLVRAGGLLAPAAPEVVVPIARRVLRRLVGDLVLDADDDRLGAGLARLSRDGVRLNVNLLGEAVLGDAEAARRLEHVHRLVLRPDVDYVSLKVSAVLGPHNPWGFDEAVERAVGLLEPLYRSAATQPEPVFINLDMEEYHDLHLTLAVFRRLLDLPGLQGLAAGVVLQAYLPDALPRMQELSAWARDRVDRGGAPIRLRLVKGANLAMETVDALLHDWPPATTDSKEATDANYLRLLDHALTPENTRAIRLGVAGHNLFTLAAAWELAGLRGVRDRVEVEMLAGMAPAQAEVVRAEVGGLRLYVPVVRPSEFDVAIAYLVRRLEENSSADNFLASLVDPSPEAGLARERSRFEAAAGRLLAEQAGTGTPDAVGPRRTQDRTQGRHVAVPAPRTAVGHVVPAPDTDTALPANLAWGRAILSRVPTSRLGLGAVEAARVADPQALEEVLARTAAAGAAWHARPRAERAAIVHRIGAQLEASRADLLEVAAAECGKTLDQSDPEVSEAVDFARYYAARSLELDGLVGGTFRPVDLTVVTPPWNFPLSIPLGGVAAALAAGSAVIFKPATAARRCGALLAEACWRAGVPRDVLALVVPDDPELGRRLVSDPRVGRVVLTGSADTAELFRSWRPDLPLMAETSGKNAIVVTPSADRDLAVRDVVTSAFGHAGQKCSAASLVILVGAAGRSTRLRDQLIDATRSLTVGPPTDPSSQVGPLTTALGDKLRRGLTTLEPGQEWVLRPRALDPDGRLWTPGIRSGVVAGSEFHLVEYFGPVLGVVTVPDLVTAVEVQNGTDYGLTAGLHSLDPDEIAYWLARVHAGNAYVNRGITGAIVGRQPFGGWKRSSVGTGNKAGGPNYLFGFGEVVPAAVDQLVPEPSAPILRRVLEVGRTVLSAEESVRLEVAVGLDQEALDEEFGIGHDPAGLGVERNVLRYLPAPVLIRLGEGRPVSSLVRELSAALALYPEDDPEARRTPGLGHRVSTAVQLPQALEAFLHERGIPVLVESDADFLARARHVGHRRDGRVRLLGGDPTALAEALDGSIDVAVYAGPVVEAGRVALLPYVHEQAVSITAHRYGHPVDLPERVGL
ncbi:L-proline dehydrogenase /delta-1-pyrroline-5-carboxylate dehydrogenase [Raineyella antarctica]|uniref:L-glutamate gamma-semialdehyde dehydrogenase n=1 Tax=Raineyella antarctica TaxID=1577474 RepID=A0A1G6GH87_9ACTN|nr:proline dehydrogenase family protein [Raineyella antarctica]SDB81310.1 L-proline dehydrogenase /delta-1-pyrroline-5-carboxylate dehydrogenase [Raineyella antarctica]